MHKVGRLAGKNGVDFLPPALIQKLRKFLGDASLSRGRVVLQLVGDEQFDPVHRWLVVVRDAAEVQHPSAEEGKARFQIAGKHGRRIKADRITPSRAPRHVRRERRGRHAQLLRKLPFRIEDEQPPRPVRLNQSDRQRRFAAPAHAGHDDPFQSVMPVHALAGGVGCARFSAPCTLSRFTVTKFAPAHTASPPISITSGP